MTSEDVQTNLRLPLALKERVATAAVQNKRSLSAEVAARLEESFNSPSEPDVTIHIGRLDVLVNGEPPHGEIAKRIAEEVNKVVQAAKLPADH